MPNMNSPFYIGQPVMIVGGVQSLIGVTGTIIDQLIHYDDVSVIHQVDSAQTLNGVKLFFQSQHLMPLNPPKDIQDEEVFTLYDYTL